MLFLGGWERLWEIKFSLPLEQTKQKTIASIFGIWLCLELMPRVATNALCQPEKNTFAKEGRAKEQKNLQTDQLNNPKVYCTPEFPL